MEQLSQENIQRIIDQVVERLANGHGSELPTTNGKSLSTAYTPHIVSDLRPLPTHPTLSHSQHWDAPQTPLGHAPAIKNALVPSASTPLTSGIFSTIPEAVDAAKKAQHQFIQLSLTKRKEIIEKIRCVLRSHVDELSILAVEETGLGRIEDKKSKNKLVIDKTPGPEILDPQSFTGDDGLCLIECAPYGVIGAITPTTNPSETVINNGIGMLSAGNSVIFNPHPSAKKVSNRTVELFNEAILSCGGPPNVVCSILNPTIESATELMKAAGVRLLVVTGGPAVVKAAMASSKKVIAAGPGNPPVVVDETADLDQAAKGIIAGASLDNNIVCIAEKEIIVVDSVADALMAALKKHGAYQLSSQQIRQLEPILIEGREHLRDVSATNCNVPNKNFIGKNANVILRQIGIHTSDDIRLAFGEVADENHPFVQTELLMPILPLVRVRSVGEAIEMAVRVEHGFCHTAVMYSKNIDNLHRMARLINTSIFVKNAPSYAGLGLGGEGYTSFTIASPTGEGLTTARQFSRIRRCVLKDHFRIV